MALRSPRYARTGKGLHVEYNGGRGLVDRLDFGVP